MKEVETRIKTALQKPINNEYQKLSTPYKRLSTTFKVFFPIE